MIIIVGIGIGCSTAIRLAGLAQQVRSVCAEIAMRGIVKKIDATCGDALAVS
jgi:hypothetical protein